MIPLFAQGTVTDLPAPFEIPDIAWSALTPLLVLAVGGLLLLTFSSLIPALQKSSMALTIYTVAISIGAIGTTIPLWNRVQRVCDQGEVCQAGPFSTAATAWGVDGFSLFLTVLLAASVGLSALLVHDYLQRENLVGPEPYVLLMLSASGGVVMASANDLIVVFIGLEILSIAVYVLAGMHLLRLASQEAAIKYLVLGAFASAFFLYGIALVYGATGSTSLIGIQGFLASNVLTSSGTLLAGIAMLLVGFSFKIAAVPFHFWTPDVYQGAPSPIVAYMASGVKVAGFAGLIRVFALAFTDYSADDWRPFMLVLAILTMAVGALLAIVQTDVKRTLAYSSISHAGFIMVGVHSASDVGVSAALFYLGAYTFIVAGSFGVITLVGRRGDNLHELSDYHGLSRRRPMLAVVFTVFLLAQAGVPLTSGFFAKFYVIRSAVDSEDYGLAVVAMITAVIGAFLYLRIIVAMFMSDPLDELASHGHEIDADGNPVVLDDAAVAERKAAREEIEAGEGPAIRVPVMAGVSIGIALVVTVVVGFLPGVMSGFANDALPSLIAAGG